MDKIENTSYTKGENTNRFKKLTPLVILIIVLLIIAVLFISLKHSRQTVYKSASSLKITNTPSSSPPIAVISRPASSSSNAIIISGSVSGTVIGISAEGIEVKSNNTTLTYLINSSTRYISTKSINGKNVQISSPFVLSDINVNDNVTLKLTTARGTQAIIAIIEKNEK